MKKSGELKQMQEIAHKLSAQLLSTDAAPCTEEKHKNQSCITAEEERPLTKEEKAKDWHRRPFNAYDHRRMCNGCAAYWFASMASNVLNEMQCWAVRIEAEEERK